MSSDDVQSFYFFDFDDNIMFLDTKILIQNTFTSEVIEISTGEFARIGSQLGVSGDWEEFAIYEDSYKYFRDNGTNGEDSLFVSDIKTALTKDPKHWQAPSWDFFVHACAKQRPLSIITARGHNPETIKHGIRHLVEVGWINQEPNYLTVFPVNNDDVRLQLGDTKHNYTTPTLKKLAIQESVEVGLQQYGDHLPHQFGMSDDDLKNINLIIEAMRECKFRHLDKRFFVFNTHINKQVKLEVLPIGMP